MQRRETIFHRLFHQTIQRRKMDTFTLKHGSLLITFLNFSILVFVLSLSQTQAQATCQPSAEVVSIYGNFSTPLTFEDYYIEVLRCVKCPQCGNAAHLNDTPVPLTTSTIKIAVSPTTTKDYYEYSVFNHTTCGCGSKEYRNKTTSVKRHWMSKGEGKNKSLSNPVKVKNTGKPQLRYKLVPNSGFDRYYAVEKCIPSCPSTKKSRPEHIRVNYRNGNHINITNQNDTKCDCSQSGASRKDRVPNDTKDFSLTLDSKKTFYISVLLTALLVIILLLDFTFCRQKKGFCYSVINCNSQGQQECPRCNTEETFV